MAAIILGVLFMAVGIVFYALIWPRIKQKMMRYFTPREVLTQRDTLEQQRAYIESVVLSLPVTTYRAAATTDEGGPAEDAECSMYAERRAAHECAS